MNFVLKMRHFFIIAVCKILKWNIECLMIVKQGEKVIVETIIWKGNEIIGEYTFI
jgi:hypothetical protein